MEEVRILKIIKKGKKYQVFTSMDEEGVLLLEDTIINNRIIKDNVFQSDQWKKIKNSQNDELLFMKALHYIDYKPRSQKEVIQYLEDRSATKEVIARIQKRLIAIGYLDDRRYAITYTDESIRNGKGPTLIKYNLENLGISDEIIQEALSKFSEADENQKALELATKYLNQVKEYPPRKQKELIYQKLVRSGFGSSASLKVLTKLQYHSLNIDQLVIDFEKMKKKTTDKNKIIQGLMQKGYEYDDIKTIINGILITPCE